MTAFWQTADTAGYLVLGMAAIFGLMAVYVLRLRSRSRSLREELEELRRNEAQKK
ncbi:MAG: hypothetical protein WD040_04675 [Anaerolineales bacterium]